MYFHMNEAEAALNQAGFESLTFFKRSASMGSMSLFITLCHYGKAKSGDFIVFFDELIELFKT